MEGDGFRCELPGIAASPAVIPPSAPWAAALLRRGPGRIDLGLRPEHLRPIVTPGALPITGPALVAEAAIHRTEPLGHELLVLLDLGPQRLTLRWPRPRPLPSQTALTIALDLALENLLDEDYRVHGSGTNEAGRNLIVGVTLSL